MRYLPRLWRLSRNRPRKHTVSVSVGEGILTWEEQQPEMAAKYRERGVSVPLGSSVGRVEAALWPYKPRARHQRYADRHGYFWIPCPRCKEPFGGHEVHGTKWTSPGRGHGICPICTVKETGGTLT